MRKLMLLGLLVSTSASAQAGPQTYLYLQGRAALLLQWTVANGQLTGTAQVFKVDPSLNGINATTLNATVTGTASGTALALTSSKALIDNASSFSGMLNGAELTLQYPQSAGGFGKLLLKKTTLDAFNQVVSSMRAQAEKDVLSLRQQNAETVAENELERLKADLDYFPAEIERLAGDLSAGIETVDENVRDLEGRALKAVTIQETLSSKGCENGRAFVQDAQNEAGDLRTLLAGMPSLLEYVRATNLELQQALAGFESTRKKLTDLKEPLPAIPAEVTSARVLGSGVTSAQQAAAVQITSATAALDRLAATLAQTRC